MNHEIHETCNYQFFYLMKKQILILAGSAFYQIWLFHTIQHKIWTPVQYEPRWPSQIEAILGNLDPCHVIRAKLIFIYTASYLDSYPIHLFIQNWRLTKDWHPSKLCVWPVKWITGVSQSLNCLAFRMNKHY